MPEVVATIPSKPLGTCAAVTLNILPRSSCGMRCGRTKGERRVHVATNFYTPKLLTFQPAVSVEGIRSGVGQWFWRGGSIQHSAFSIQLPGALDIFKWRPQSSRNWLNADCCFSCKSRRSHRSKEFTRRYMVLLGVVGDRGFPVTIGACACVGDGRLWP